MRNYALGHLLLPYWDAILPIQNISISDQYFKKTEGASPLPLSLTTHFSLMALQHAYRISFLSLGCDSENPPVFQHSDATFSLSHIATAGAVLLLLAC